MKTQSLQRRGRLGAIVELISHLNLSGNTYLIPLVLGLLGAGVMLAAISLVEYVAPFVYTVF